MLCFSMGNLRQLQKNLIYKTPSIKGKIKKESKWAQEKMVLQLFISA